jgi:hypothetical protein
MPKIYLRTDTDPATKKSYREIVDGQQRVLAIKSYVHNEFPLGVNKAIFEENAGKKFSDLDTDTQKQFLQYLVPCEQLFNASDAVVFDIFRRLNTYNYRLTPQELRHGKYQGPFREAVLETSRKWSVLWDKYEVVTKRSRVRMADDELVAQMYGVILEGVCDGGQPAIERLYKTYDVALQPNASKRINSTLEFILGKLEPVMWTRLCSSPHFLLLFAAVAHALFGIPKGDMGEDFPPENMNVLKDIPSALTNLQTLAEVLDLDLEEIPQRFREFKRVSLQSTQRISSRRIRFPMLFGALLPDPI